MDNKTKTKTEMNPYLKKFLSDVKFAIYMVLGLCGIILVVLGYGLFPR